MKRSISTIMAVMLGICLLTTGCSNANWNLDRIAPVLESTTSLIAKFAFADPRVAPHKEQICGVTDTITDVLDQIDDPDATFLTVKKAVLDAIGNIPDDKLPPAAKEITLAVVEFVLDQSWAYLRDNYLDLVNKDEAKAALILAKAVANGIESACAPVTSFSVEAQSLTEYLDKYQE